MEWYLGCAVDDLVVPSNLDIVNMFPSPNSWSQWELSSAEAFDPTSKYFVAQTNFNSIGLNFNGKRQNKVGMDLFEYQQDAHSTCSDVCQEYKEGSVNQDTSSCDISDYQLDDLDMTKQTDDIFMCSSHDIGADAYTGPFDYSGPEFENDEYGVLPGDSLFENMTTESECDQSHLYGMGSSKYLKTHGFSPPAGGGDRVYSQFPKLRESTPSPIEAPYEEVPVSPEFKIMDEHINKETSEASVLQELDVAMTQMSDHSRICFRDALYRLAENSKQQSVDFALERGPLLTVHSGDFRLETSKKMEAETNVIDGAVTNIMFCKKDSNVQNLPNCHSSSLEDAEISTMQTFIPC